MNKEIDIYGISDRYYYLPKLMKVKDGFVRLAGHTYEKMGVELVDDLSMYYYVILPEGWSTTMPPYQEFKDRHFDELLLNARQEVVGRIRYYQNVEGIINRTLFLEDAEDEKPRSAVIKPGHMYTCKIKEKEYEY